MLNVAIQISVLQMRIPFSAANYLAKMLMADKRNRSAKYERVLSIVIFKNGYKITNYKMYIIILDPAYTHYT